MFIIKVPLSGCVCANDVIQIFKWIVPRQSKRTNDNNDVEVWIAFKSYKIIIYYNKSSWIVKYSKICIYIKCMCRPLNQWINNIIKLVKKNTRWVYHSHERTLRPKSMVTLITTTTTVTMVLCENPTSISTPAIPLNFPRNNCQITTSVKIVLGVSNHCQMRQKWRNSLVNYW